jgi:hypothetical protein
MAEDTKETIIRLDHRTNMAQIWTQRPGLIAKAKRAGFAVEKEHHGGFWLSGPLKRISIRKKASGGAGLANLGHSRNRPPSP